MSKSTIIDAFKTRPFSSHSAFSERKTEDYRKEDSSPGQQLLQRRTISERLETLHCIAVDHL